MKSTLKLSWILGLLIVFSACSPTKKMAKEAEEKAKEEKMKTEKIITDAGYVKALVVNRNGSDGCGFLFEVIDTKELISPLKWPEDNLHQKEGNIVWIKYKLSDSPQTTCLISKPAAVTEIKLVQ